MDHLDPLRAVFSFAAHAVLAESAGELDVADAKAALAGIDSLIDKAFALRRPANFRAFDPAWFPVRAWLEEKTAGLRRKAGGGTDALSLHLGPSSNSGEEFFPRLDALLAARARGVHEAAERRGILEMYHIGLELGFRGRHSGPEGVSELISYRRRCLAEMADARAERPASGPRTGAPAGGTGKTERVGMAMFWIVPAAVTLALFLLYRFILTNSFLQAIG